MRSGTPASGAPARARRRWAALAAVVTVAAAWSALGSGATPAAAAPIPDIPGLISIGSGGYQGFTIGTDNAVWSLALAADGETWGAWTSLGGIATGRPAAAFNGTDSFVFVRGYDNAIWYKRTTGTPNSWQANWTPLGGIATSAPAAVGSPGGVVTVFVRGYDNGLWRRRIAPSDDGFWTPLGGIVTSNPSATWDGVMAQVAVRGYDNGMWVRRSNADMTSWGTSWSSLGGIVTADPASAYSGATSAYLFVRGYDDAMWFSRWTGSSWATWQHAGGLLTAAPAAIGDADGVSSFVRGYDNATWWKRFEASSLNGGGWDKFTIIQQP